MTNYGARPILVAAAVSRAPGAAVLLVAAASVLIFVEVPSVSNWLGQSADTGLFLTVFSFAIAGCLFAVVGYLSGAQWSIDPGNQIARSVRSASQVVTFRAIGDLVWLGGALLIVHSLAYGRSVIEGAQGIYIAWPLSVLGMASALSCYCVAAAFGSLMRTVFGVVLVAPAPYAATLFAGEVALSSRPEAQQLIAPFIDQSWYPNLLPAPIPILQLSGYSLALAAAAFILVLAYLTRHEQASLLYLRVGLFPIFAIVITAHLVTSNWSPNGFARENPWGPLCNSSGSVCVWQNLSADLVVYDAAERRVRGVIQDVVALPDLKFYQYGLELPDDDAVWIDVSSPHPDELDAVAQMVSAYVEVLLAECLTSSDGITAFGQFHADFLDAVLMSEQHDLEVSYEAARDAC